MTIDPTKVLILSTGSGYSLDFIWKYLVELESRPVVCGNSDDGVDVIRGIDAEPSIVYLDIETTEEEIIARFKERGVEVLHDSEHEAMRRFSQIIVTDSIAPNIATEFASILLEPQKAVEDYAEDDKPLRFKPTKRDMKRENRRQMNMMRGRK